MGKQIINVSTSNGAGEMLKKRLIGLLTGIGLFWIGVPALSAETDYQKLFTYMADSFPEQRQIISKISAVHQNRILFSRKNVSLENARELLILHQPPKTPDALLPVIGVLRIERVANGSYVARQIAVFGDLKPEAGDPVVTPAAPSIYLYSNINGKNGFAPYQKLLQKLLDHNYEVLEVDSLENPPASEQYAILLRLEGTGDTLVTKLQSVYSGATFYSDAWAYEPAFQTNAPAGRPLATIPAEPTRMPNQTDSREKSEKAMPPARKSTARLPSAESQKPDFQRAQREAGANFQPLRLDDKFQRLVICQLDATEALEFVLLNDDKVQVFHKINSGLHPVYDYAFENSGIIGIHLHAMDLSGDGRDELAVTLGSRQMAVDAWTTRLCSQILSVQDNRLQPIDKDIPHYLRVISDREGNAVLLGQAKGTYEPFTGAILKIDLAADGNLLTSMYAPAKGVYSLYQFNLLPGHPANMMILEPANHISVYHAETEKIAAITDQNYGSYETVAYPIILEKPEFRGGFDKKTSADCFAPRRFCLKPQYDDQIFTINKQREMNWGLGKLKNLISSEKARDSLAAVKWTGQAIRQTYESKSMAKDILDFSFMPGADKDAIFILVKDAQGFALLRME